MGLVIKFRGVKKENKANDIVAGLRTSNHVVDYRQLIA